MYQTIFRLQPVTSWSLRWLPGNCLEQNEQKCFPKCQTIPLKWSADNP